MLFAFPDNSFAIQGTCSYHGGVDCRAGADWDGSAICIDGWRDSSERFYSQKKCQEDLHHCSIEVSRELDEKYQIKGLTAKKELGCREIEAITQDVLSSDYSSDNRSYSETVEDALRAMEASARCVSAQDNLRFALNQSRNECYSIGEQEYYEEINNLYIELLRKQKVPIIENKTTAIDQTTKLKTPDELCRLSTNNPRSWYHTENKYCITCPAGSEHTPNTNKCVSSSETIQKTEELTPVNQAMSVKQQPILNTDKQKEVEKISKKEDVATTVKQKGNSEPIIKIEEPKEQFPATTSDKEKLATTEQVKTLWGKFTTPVKSWWKRIFK